MSLALHTLDPWSSNLSISSLPSNCFLSDVVVFDCQEPGSFVPSRRSDLLPMAEKAVATGTAEVSTQRMPYEAGAAIAIPVYRGGDVVSVVVLLARQCDSSPTGPVGVFEVWEPIGVYQEVALKAGYYGSMERFQNVSSFVRFEKNSGLPGQIWQHRCGVIHDDLATHPGFLRAAGASAETLRTAVGIPVAGDHFRAAAVLISSSRTPIARGMEVWSVRPDCDEFELISAAYYDLGEDYPLPIGTRRGSNLMPFARLKEEKRALVTDDPNELLAGRDQRTAAPGPTSGLAVPFFDGITLTSITLFLF